MQQTVMHLFIIYYCKYYFYFDRKCPNVRNDVYMYTVKLVYNDTLGATKMCCYNQVVVVTRTFSTETIESVPAMCVVVKR